MSKWYPKKWETEAQTIANETTQALQTVVDSLNQGQRQKLAKNPEVMEIFIRYGVVI